MRGWQIIFRKEFREVFREGRTRFAVIVSPLLVTPLILALVGTMARNQVTETQKETMTVAIVGLDKAPAAARLLRGAAEPARRGADPPAGGNGHSRPNDTGRRRTAARCRAVHPNHAARRISRCCWIRDRRRRRRLRGGCPGCSRSAASGWSPSA